MKQRIIKPEAFIAAITQANNGSFGSMDSDAFEMQQETTRPIPGFQAGKDFYHCQECETKVRHRGGEILKAFPDCCENHRKLIEQKWFAKTDYSYLPDKLVNTLAYTYHCIANSINDPDWFKRITDYIEYTIQSYGQFPEGFGPPLGLNEYLEYIQLALVKEFVPDKEKLELLLKWLKELRSPPTKRADTPDLHILMATYKQWLKEFPFELTFLNHLKPHFENRLPFVERLEDTNLYTNLTTAKLVTKDQLLEYLFKTTNTILTTINTHQLYGAGKISEPNRILLDLVLAERRQRLLVGYTNPSPDEEVRYRRILKEWIKDEREFIKALIEIGQSE